MSAMVAMLRFDGEYIVMIKTAIIVNIFTIVPAIFIVNYYDVTEGY